MGGDIGFIDLRVSGTYLSDLNLGGWISKSKLSYPHINTLPEFLRTRSFYYNVLYNIEHTINFDLELHFTKRPSVSCKTDPNLVLIPSYR